MNRLILLILLGFSFFSYCEPYERFVGLGNCCVSRFQINSYLSKKSGLHHKSFGGGQLFDWLVIHDYEKLSEAIENNLEDIFERKDLVLSYDIIQPSVKNIRYQMSWNHLFSRLENGHLSHNIIDVEYDIVKNKIDYLSKKFIQLKKYRTLYIIAYPFDPGFINTIEPSKKSIIRLIKALIKMRGNENFSILFCPRNKKFDDFANVYVRQVANSKTAHITQGDDQEWEKVLSEFEFSFKKIEVDHTQLDDTLISR